LTLSVLGIKNDYKLFPESQKQAQGFRKNIKEFIMPQIMTTKELAKYLKLHEITICKYAAEGKIPAIRIGRVWRFDKEAIDKWISGGQKK
jgi:excisionase family DNA binding protein